MLEAERLRDQVEKCRRLALMAGDAEIKRRIDALGDEFEAKAVRAGAVANGGHGVVVQLDADSDERRKIAQTNFNRSW
jgi:hypothetical protein